MMRFNPRTVAHELYEDEYGSRDVFCFKKVSSTNIIGRNLALKGYNVAVMAESQFLGHGRMSRRWESATGGLYLTVSLKTDLNENVASTISMAVSLAILKSVYELTGVKCSIKWPNDLLVNGRKICGILSEAVWGTDKLDCVIVGLGLNVNQNITVFSAELKDHVTSFYMETGKQYIIKDVAFSLMHHMNCELNDLSAHRITCILEQYRERCDTIGKKISIKDREDVIFQGEAVAINEGGALIVKDESGHIEIFHYGEVSNRLI